MADRVDGLGRGFCGFRQEVQKTVDFTPFWQNLQESTMRKAQTTWLEIGGVFIEINPGSRDDMPALLSGLQHLQVTAELRGRVFALLKTEVRPEVCRDSGRPGMNRWNILVLAVLRQRLDCDLDWLARMTSHDGLVRQMMGTEPWIMNTGCIR